MGVFDFLARAPKSLRGRSAMPAEDIFDDEFQRKLDYLAMVSKRYLISRYIQTVSSHF